MPTRDVQEQFARQAIELAREARAEGNHPFGSLLVDGDGNVVLEAENTVVTGRDCTAHAEQNLVRAAVSQFEPDQLATFTLYTSTEPCAMCAGAIFWSGIGRVVFALAESELSALTGDDPENPTLSLPCREVFAAGQRPIEVLGPYALPEALEVHRDFWKGAS